MNSAKVRLFTPKTSGVALSALAVSIALALPGQAEERKAKRGRLTIFLGAAPGVGVGD